MALLGDNTAALNAAVSYRGKNVLGLISREISWRKVRFGWRYAVGHLPSEHNLLADALSRLDTAAGSERKDFPKELARARQVLPTPWSECWVGV